MSDSSGDPIHVARERWLGTGPAARPGVGHDSAALLPGDLYTPIDVPAGPEAYLDQLGFPGEYPFTRGIHHSMYGGRLWTMRQYAGFGSAAETNERFKQLLRDGGEGLNVAFDLPTQHGLDSDDPRAEGEVGKVGVPINSLRDFEILFDEVDLNRANPANAINAPAAIIVAMYVVLAERRGLDLTRLAGSIQNDILKEFLARGTYVFPPRPSLRLVTDVIEFCCRSMPRWNFINVCGYHMREAGSTLVQEVAFGLADGIAYVDAALDRGLAIDGFASRIAFNFTAGTNIFEEAAKFRAMRRMWARLMRERFGAERPESWLFRAGAGSAASQLTSLQPENNIVRVALQTLAAAMGGVQSLHTAAWDEALALPTEASTRLALRTQQIVAHEAGLIAPVDPLAGSYYVEALTNQIEVEASSLIDEIERRGGMLAAIEAEWPQRLIAQAAWEQQLRVESGGSVVVGVNRYEQAESARPLGSPFRVSANAAVVTGLRELRASRDGAAVQRTLERLRVGAQGETNLMPALIDAVGSYATVGEICTVLREVFGEYRPAGTY